LDRVWGLGRNVSGAILLTEWEALLERRPAFRDLLAPYGQILKAWARWPRDRVAPLPWTAEECGERWQRGVPLLSEGAPTISADEMEGLLDPVIELLATLGFENAALGRFTEAWDEGTVGPAALFPGVGRVGTASVQDRLGLSQECLAFLACGSLRPILEPYFLECRPHLEACPWDLGVCPFCGGPPGFADLLEDGKRRLACHLCGGGWGFSRLRCPYCGNRNPGDLIRFLAEESEEGYAMTACKACRGYLKEIDRRVRWNAGSALVEDWGSPHLDLIAHRAGYWRGIPSLIQLGKPEEGL
jgi:FdhE protein